MENKKSAVHQQDLLSDVDDDSSKLFKNMKHFLLKNFEKEITEDYELEKKYNLNHTEEELNYRKELQKKFLFYHKQRDRQSFNGMRKTWKWLRKHYINMQVKDSLDSYEYSKHIRNDFLKLMLNSFIKSTVYTFAIFVWMRLVKHKGKKDFMFLVGVNAFLGVSLFSGNCFFLLMRTRLPLSRDNLTYRKELIEEYVFGCNKSIVLTEEIKKISKFYLPEKIEYSYITSLGQKVTYIVFKGRLYLSCDNYAEVFGYSGKNKLAKMDLLNVMVVREREIIYGLFKMYDMLIDNYINKYKIGEKPKSFETQILEEISEELKLTPKQIEMLKNSRLVKNVDFNKINTSIELGGNEEIITFDKNDTHNSDKNNKDSNNPNNPNNPSKDKLTKKFYI